MLITEVIKAVWAPNIKKHYESLGYKWTRQGDKFDIKIEDLSPKSNKKVIVSCDYCNKIFEKTYCKYNQQRALIKKDSCYECKSKKAKESNTLIYGVENPMQVKEISKKAGRAMATPISNIRDLFLNNDFILISKEYKNAFTKMDVLCIYHLDFGIQKISKSSIDHGCRGCYKCRYDKMTGENNHNWKGGTASIQRHCRAILTTWKKVSLKNNDYKCSISQKNSSNLEVHHSYPFNNILDETLCKLNLSIKSDISDYTESEIKAIEDEILLRHETVEGIPLTQELHKMFHFEYGYYNFNIYDFYEFKNKYINIMEEFKWQIHR